MLIQWWLAVIIIANAQIYIYIKWSAQKLQLPCNSIGINWLVPGKHACNVRSVIFKPIVEIDISSSFCETDLWWMPQNIFNNMPASVQVLAWCHQATSHYLSQCWYRSMWLCGVNRPHFYDKSRCVLRSSSLPCCNLSINPLCAIFFFMTPKNIFISYKISQQGNGTEIWKPFSRQGLTYRPGLILHAADDPATQGARTSATIVLSPFAHNIPASAPNELNIRVYM